MTTRAAAALRGVAFGAKVAWQVYHPPSQALGPGPDSLGMTFETWQWRTRRGDVPVEGWFVEGAGPDAVLVQHGIGRNRSATLRHVELLHRAGFHVLTVDMRNHGASGRCRSVTGMSRRYTSDLVDALQRLRSDGRVTGSLTCLAMSFSTWPALRAAATLDAHRLGLRAVVCDSGPVPDIRRAVARFARALAMREDAVSTPFARRVVEAVAPAAAAAILADPRWPAVDVPVPVLLVTGSRDRLLPTAEVTGMLPHLPGATTWEAARAPHLGAVTSDPEGYRERVVGFLRAHSDVRPGAREGSA